MDCVEIFQVNRLHDTDEPVG